MGHRICREVLGRARIACTQATRAMLPTQIPHQLTTTPHDASMQLQCGVLTEQKRKSFAVANSGRYGEEIADPCSAIVEGSHPKPAQGESLRNMRAPDRILA